MSNVCDRDVTIVLNEYDTVELLEAIEKLSASVQRGVFNSRNGTEWRNAMELRARNIAKIRATVAAAYAATTGKGL